jgi:serine/threonine-protein kinase
MQTAATKPAAAVAHGYLNIVFSLQRTPQRHQVMLLRMALDSPALASGLSEGQHTKDEDRAAGTMRPVSTSYGRNTEPRLACIADGCFAVWDDEKAGALAAFIDKQQGETLWRREFAATGSRPSVASSNLGAVVAYYESSRLRMAPITRDGVGKSSILTRVSGFQPYPTLTPGSAPGEWYVAWRDYEAGHLESFLLSAMCQ